MARQPHGSSVSSLQPESSTGGSLPMSYNYRGRGDSDCAAGLAEGVRKVAVLQASRESSTRRVAPLPNTGFARNEHSLSTIRESGVRRRRRTDRATRCERGAGGGGRTHTRGEPNGILSREEGDQASDDIHSQAQQSQELGPPSEKSD